MDQVNNTRPRPVILIILDGWGVADNNPGNAIAQANTPFFSSLINDYPTTIIEASSEAVGLPWGEMGNSEVGHMTIGSGRIAYQDFPRITKAIWEKTFFENQAFLKAIEHAKKNRSKLHYMGLLSSGGVHSYIEHLYALLDLAVKKKMDEVYLHIFLDGRDTPYNSGMNFVKRLMERIERVGIGKIATTSGR
jgi:2,3-bisphosphoglycerate-independent phosphoglycerate mutase